MAARHWGRGEMPVINVSWGEAKQYAGWLSRLTGKEYRLLTEAEWEYAARAGANTRYSWVDDQPAIVDPLPNVAVHVIEPQRA